MILCKSVPTMEKKTETHVYIERIYSYIFLKGNI
jgi:hypothetical protein